MAANWKLEDDVNDFVKHSLESLQLKKTIDYNVESAMSDYMKDALKGSAKTKNKTNFGKPDFHIEKYKIKNNAIPVVFEDKLHLNKLIALNSDGIKDDEKSVSAFAVNGAIYYATQMIASGKYNEVIAIGVAGDSESDVKIDVYFVYGSSFKTIKQIPKYQTLDFLENQITFENFYNDCVLTDEDKHELLIKSKAELSTYAKELNKLMHNHNITAPQRVLYVSGMLLSMQDIFENKDSSDERKLIQEGLIPEDLKGLLTESKRDGILITSQIDEFLKAKGIPEEKRKLMIASFNEISKDKQRDEPTNLFPQVSKLIKEEKVSANKQIFIYIYNNIYLQIDAFSKNLDIMGELYSEFLKYALGDGKELGIVLTPPYVTKMMAQILNITYKNKVMDLATGSAGFLISSMELMINSANEEFSKGSTKAKEIIEEIKKKRLLGVELNAEMFTLAATNMILRGDGSSNIQKGSSFDKPDSLYTDFNADRILLNPPFTFEENGMPFIAYGLDRMQKGGLGAIIIQDSAGSGKAVKSNQQILKNHTLVASIKMPVDLFQPMAGVQTSIYIFEAGTPHDYEKTVKFIDFSNDGYKRTSRSLIEQDEPIKRYSDIIKIFKSGKNAKSKIEANWDLDATYTEDFITDSGTDWNFGAHIKIDTKPTLEDFKKTVADYLAWEVSNIIKNNAENDRLGK
ncbi:MAG: SAM-dependent methyltransferase [Treponema sp.]|uniref:HsdM family class I SAM-dependent methyltransferase n=1 Tax=Treponema sp. TaxID=166 RepID=UPI00298DDECB|nr:N-6 DNA methylase [Treponema sp.]MCQ2601791.1 SAM-dependent methyltransferase [Treponema sp.]